MKSLKMTLLLALPMALLIGCATTEEAGPEGEIEGVAVQVDNNLIPARSLTIWLVSDTGFRDMLGSVSPNDVSLFSAEGANTLGQYRLVAEATGGRDLISRTFYINERTETVQWDVNANIVNVVGN
jgi:hypothetical protein